MAKTPATLVDPRLAKALMRTVPRRGATEHYYRALVRPLFSDCDWKRLPRSVRQGVSDVGMQPLTLDDRGWEQLSRLLQETQARAEAISAESGGRLQRATPGGVSTRLVMMHFEMPDTDGPARR